MCRDSVSRFDFIQFRKLLVIFADIIRTSLTGGWCDRTASVIYRHRRSSRVQEGICNDRGRTGDRVLVGGLPPLSFLLPHLVRFWSLRGALDILRLLHFLRILHFIVQDHILSRQIWAFCIGYHYVTICTATFKWFCPECNKAPFAKQLYFERNIPEAMPTRMRLRQNVLSQSVFGSFGVC